MDVAVKTSVHRNKPPNIEVRTRSFALSIIKLSTKLRRYNDFWTITNQLSRSGTSIAANVAEAKFASSKKDFLYFRSIALKSTHETRFWLDLLLTSITENTLIGPADVLITCKQLITEVTQIEAILCQIVKKLRLSIYGQQETRSG